MTSYRDLLRSAIARAAGAARTSGAFARVREALATLQRRQVRIKEGDLGAAVARATGVQQAMVRCDDGGIRVDASYVDGDTFVASVIPSGVYFAPRGAKEIAFRIEPAEAGRSRHAADVVAALAGAIARGFYGPFLGRKALEKPAEPAGFVDREADDAFRADLRTVPSVRRLAAGGPMALVVDLLDVKSIGTEPGAVRLEVKLPDLGGA